METKTKWVVDPSHSEVHFKVKHLVISTVTGSFGKFEGEVVTGSDDFSDSQINFSIDADSIDTNSADRDGHLKSPDFFDAASFPKITFQSTSFKKKGDSYALQGNLTIKGVTKQVELEVEHGGVMKDPWGNIKAGFEVSGKINRKDFGLTWNAATETGGLVVGEEVKLMINIELAKL